MTALTQLRFHHADVPRVTRTDRGIRTLKVSLFFLIITAVAEAIAVWFTGSVALLADTVHNFADALVAVPLWFAFSISKKKPTAIYPYGFYRIEDLVGLGVLGVIAVSGLWTGYESLYRMIHHVAPRNIFLGMTAGLIGGLGNEIVARYRLRIGKEIHSHALMAEGHHARVDALTSLGVVVGLAFAALGFPLADPLTGLIITVLIFSIVFEVGKDLLTRMLGKTEDHDLEEIKAVASRVEGVEAVGSVRLQWLGHRCFAEMCIAVSPQMSVIEARRITETVRHELLHHVASVIDVNIHADPYSAGTSDSFHETTAHHF